MINITLPDGSRREFEHPVSVAEVAASIGAGLAKAALAGKVDGKLVDTGFRIDNDASLEIVTDKHPDALDVLRHSTAHLLAQAVQRLFPGAQVTIGPVIDNGFYYDFAYERPFTPEDLPAIEAEMQKIVKEAMPVSRSVKSRDDAVAYFKGIGEHYKAEIIESIPAGEELSLYTQGEFTDLCRGPHVPGTDKLRAFKLMKVAGAYWRGDSNNQMLSRIYGTAWLNDKDLKAYLHAARGSREARPPQDRQAAGPVPPAGRGAGPGVLASQGLVDLAGGRAVHARRLPRQRLPGSALPADPRRVAVEEVRPLGQLQGQHVLHRVGEAHLRGQADELPGPRAGVQPGPAQLPRPADPLRRIRRLPSQRTVRRAARHPARARLHPGRRPHLLHRGRRSSPR